MPSPTKETRDGDSRDNRQSARDSGSDEAAYPVLWVGNLSVDTLDFDLMSLFGKHAVLDCMMTFSSRNFAFLYFKHSDDARAAKEDLQGALVRGNSIRIEFARPAKPCKLLWIGGISPSVTKEQLEGEVSKFGKIEDHKFNRERNSALIDFFKVDDAAAALKNMDGKELGGEKLRVDYLRTSPPPSRRDQSDYHDPKRGFSSDSHSRFPPEPSRHDGPVSRVLLIRHPPSVRIDEQMLLNAMVLFGEVDHVRTFPSRCTALVEFRTLEEARRAKEGLQGRLFNDPRIQILYSDGELGQPKEGFQYGPGPRQDAFFGDHPFGRTKYSHRGQLMGRPFHPRSEFVDDQAYNRASFSRLSPGPAPGWDGGFDGRDPKRSRTEGSPFDEASLPPRRMDGSMMRGQHLYGPGPGSPAGPRRPRDHCWRGIIAKGGNPVCHARCVPVGKGMESPLPEVVNCSARTGLELLAKHYEEADGFDIVFFLPDSEEDFASYTEFLQYLRLKNRAGVAKLDDGTTLFLVPPSDFLSHVLKVSGPERLYGVVLKIQPPVSAVKRQQTPPDLVPRVDFRHAQQSRAPPNVGYASAPMEVSLTPELIATLAAVIPSAALTGPGARPAAPSTGVAPPLIHEPQAAAQIRPYPAASSYMVPQVGVDYGYGMPWTGESTGLTQMSQQNVGGQRGAPEQAQGFSQLPAEGEADKNQRYQSTLQLAANLLLQIQQQQKQATPHQ
ncbi:flowering time control protein FPA-like [Wolffia australiana]